MKKQENSRSSYKKMSSKGASSRPDRRKAPSKPVKSVKSDNKASRKLSLSQGLIIILLIIIALILSILIFIFFQPEKVQLWQEKLIPVSGENSELPTVQRLLPREEKTLEITKLPPPDQLIEEGEKPKEEETPPVVKQTRDARLFYVKVNTEGQITLKSIIRPVEYNQSPLRETINSLLKGPSSDEINKGSLTLIPDGTRLLSARVEGNTAYLNFNEAFRFNSLGREGYTAQLKQIVYTATEFSNINSVQILIEGSIKEYLGGEGIYVGEPLSRDAFLSVP